jgi:hypothetical protein
MAADPLGPDALDFWLGEWSLTWSGGGTGTNSIRRILGDRVIEESFEGHDHSGPLFGRSLSVLDAHDGRWRQAWVDSSGAYLDFEGIDLDGGIAFQRAGPEGSLQRMRWVDRRTDELTWHWERSRDDGVSWELLWAISYRRVPGRP